MRSIHYADDQDWQLNFYVDYDFLNSIATWITKQQDPVTGAFRDLSPIYDRKFQVNLFLIRNWQKNNRYLMHVKIGLIYMHITSHIV